MAVVTEQLEALLRGEAKGMLVVGLDREGELSGVGTSSRHRALSFVKVWELAALADELAACAVAIVLVAEGRSRPPTAHEIEAFVDLRARAMRAHLVLLDCIVVRDEESWSLRELAEARLRARPGGSGHHEDTTGRVRDAAPRRRTTG
jgi:hypothetical protein